MTTPQEDISPYYIEYPGTRRGRPIRDAGTVQIVWFVISVVLIMLLVFMGQIIAVCVVVLLALLALPGDEGPYYTYPKAFWESRRIKRSDGQIFVEGSTKKSRKQAAIPYQIDSFLGQFASIYYEADNTDTVFLRVEGWEYANADVAIRHMMLMRIGAVLKTGISQTKLDIAYGFINGSRPADPTAWAMDVYDNYTHEDFRQEVDEVAKRLSANMDQVFADIAEHDSTYIGLIALTIKRPQSWKRFVQNPEKFSVAQLRRSTLYRVLSALQDGLRGAGFIGLKLLDEDELHSYVYHTTHVGGVAVDSLRVGGVPDYYRIEGVAEEDLPIIKEDGSLAHVEVPFPVSTIAVIGDDNAVLQTDNGNFHAVARATRFERNKGLPGSTDPIVAGPHDQWVLHAMTCNTTSKRRDKYFLRRAHDLRIALNKDRLSSAYVEQEDIDKAQATSDALNTLYLSGSKAIRSNHYFVVSATDMEVLEERFESLEASLRRQDVHIRRISGRSRLTSSFLLATLGPRLPNR